MFHRRPYLSWGDLALAAGSVVSLLFTQNSGVAVVEATFSIAGTDSATQSVGAAGASCVQNASIYDLLYHGVPGHGVLITQAKPPASGSPVYEIGKELLENGTDPAVIIDTITDPTLDDVMQTIPTCDGGTATYEEYKLRQYGTVDLLGRAAGYEDPTLKEYYYDFCFVEGDGKYVNYTQEHDGGSVGTFAYSAQANICTYSTVPSLVENFLGRNDSGVGCDLADRLYKAISSIPLLLQEVMETDDISLLAGDVRCFGLNGAVAAGMFLHVDNPDGTELVHIDIVGTGDPYPAFKDAYEAWRVNNSCPETANSSSTEAPSSAAVGETKMPTGTPSGGTSLKSSIHQTAALLVALVIANLFFP